MRAAYAVAGLVLGLGLVPATRWVLPLYGEILSGQWRFEPGSTVYRVVGEDAVPAGTFVPPHIAPRPELRTVDAPTSADERLVALLQADPPYSDDPAAYWARFDRLADACQAIDTPQAWAQYARLASMPAMLPPRGDPKGQAEQRQKVRTQLVAACERGERLEPDNAFFPVIRSVALTGLGRAADARAALLVAAAKPHYRGYEWVESELAAAALERRHPRSQLLRSWLTASTILPHLAGIRSMLRNQCAEGDPETRLAACRVGAAMLREGRTLVDPFVGHWILSDALVPTSGEAPVDRISADEAAVAAAALARDTGAEDLEGIAKEYARVCPAMKLGRFTPSQEQIDGLYTPAPLFGVWMFCALAGVPLVVVFARRRALLCDHLRWGLVPLVWLLALSLELGVSRSGQPSSLGFSVFALLAPLAAYPPTRKAALWVCGAGLLPMVAAFQAGWPAWVLVGAFGLAVAWGKHPTCAPRLSMAATVLAALLVGMFACFGGFLSGWNALFAGVAAAVALCPLVPSVRPGERAAALHGSVTVLGVLLAIALVAGIRADAQAGAVNDALLHEADRLRAETGVGQEKRTR